MSSHGAKFMRRLVDWVSRYLGIVDDVHSETPAEPMGQVPRVRPSSRGRDPRSSSVRVIRSDAEPFGGDQSRSIDFWSDAANHDFGSDIGPGRIARSPERRESERQATRATQTVAVLGDRRGERARLPDDIKKSRELEVVALEVPMSDGVRAVDTGTWSYIEGRAKVDAFFSAKSGDLSEDAEPLMVCASKAQRQRIFVGVFDGMGGAGASMVETGVNSFTEAYRASRIVRLECFNFVAAKVVNSVLGFGRGEVSARDLTAHLQKRLKHHAHHLGVGPGASRIRGTLTRTLPTTLACADVRIEEALSGQLITYVKTLWAGDSRVWVLSPSRGLQQLTSDDVGLDDPLEQLRQDPPMNNVVSASVDFVLNERSWRFSGQLLLVCATDGVSGYVRSPGEVEHIILQAFRRAETSGSPVARILREAFAETAHDDVSCVVTSVGFSSVTELNHMFESRRSDLENRYAALDVEVTSEHLSGLIDQIWATEGRGYCELLRGDES